jgi:hypothetical protein
MPNKTIDMFAIHKIIRLYASGRGTKYISQAKGVARNSITKYLFQYAAIRITMEALDKLSAAQLSVMYFKYKTENRPPRSLPCQAVAQNKVGQYLIAPVRYEQKQGQEYAIEGKLAIACGSLGGFGGFISKEFRIHDYFLGRSNCEQFLREHFTIPVDSENPIFVNGYKNVDKSLFLSTSGRLQIIPIFDKKQNKPYMPTFSNGISWPTIEKRKIDDYRKQIKRRTEKIINSMTDFKPIPKLLLWIGLKILITGKIADGVINYVTGSLSKHKLLD